MTYPPHLLPSPMLIRKHLADTLADMPLWVHESIDSTNTEARRLTERQLSAPYLVVAHAQTAGKGRLGRSFYSPPGSGLYMTLALDIKADEEMFSRITPAAAVAASRALEAVCQKQVEIKWVNDLYLSGKKISGILTEAIPTDDGARVLIGIGINITTRIFPEGMRNPAGAVLAQTDAPVDLSLLCATVVNCLVQALRRDHAEETLSYYRSRLMLVGRRVMCSRNFAPDGTPDPSCATVGSVIGVDDDYGLILQLDDATQTVLRGGELSVTAFEKSFK